MADVRSDFDKETYWHEVRATAVDTVAALCRRFPPFTLAFDRLRVMPAAIIAVAKDPGFVGMLREILLAALPKPPGAAQHLDLVHATLARFTSGAAIPRIAVGDIEATRLAIASRVTSLTFGRETVYPSLAVEEIAAIPVGGAVGRPERVLETPTRSEP